MQQWTKEPIKVLAKVNGGNGAFYKGNSLCVYDENEKKSADNMKVSCCRLCVQETFKSSVWRKSLKL